MTSSWLQLQQLAPSGGECEQGSQLPKSTHSKAVTTTTNPKTAKGVSSTLPPP